jgi:hypothetical protein
MLADWRQRRRSGPDTPAQGGFGMDLTTYIDKSTPAGEGSQLCKDSRLRRASEARNYKRYENLVYALTAAATIALIIAIVLVIFGQQATAIASGVGGIVTGVAAVYIRGQRDRAHKAEAKAWKDVQTHCAANVAVLDEAAHIALAK